MKATRRIKSKATSYFPDAPAIKRLTRSMRTARILARIQRQVYTKRMQESARTVLSILASTDLSRGMFMGHELIGYALIQKASQERTVYLYDLAILPQFQGRGLGTKLVQEALASAWQRQLKVRMHVRSTSRRLFVNRDKLRAAGYRLVRDRFVRDFYFAEFGVHEDAHELVLQPLSQLPLIDSRTC